MANHKDRKFWLLVGVGGFVIVILFVTLLFMAFSDKKLPDNAVVVDNAVIEGETLNTEMVEKINKLLQENPVLSNMPLTVEYYSEDLSSYTKYILTYELDNSEKGFVLIMKDYTGVGEETGFSKLRELGMDLTDVKMSYEDLTEDTLNFRADVI